MPRKKKTANTMPKLGEYIEQRQAGKTISEVLNLQPIEKKKEPEKTPESKKLDDLLKPLYGRYDSLKTVTLEQLVEAGKRAQEKYNKMPGIDREMVKLSSIDWDNLTLQELGVQHPYFELKTLKRDILDTLAKKLGVK